ncbi:hypothetical protein MRB53_002765 [Persea americana]|uniref:Uncharacterized protein n=1 Tax=Persea americana TaxID=3435 RepID=A0ACC2MXT5_PERAE|nr:hypothetical protein MRB53_002765 [Persea americana]
MGAACGEKNDGARQTVMQGGYRGESVPDGCCDVACRTDGDVGRMQGRERTWWVVDGDARGCCCMRLARR